MYWNIALVKENTFPQFSELFGLDNFSQLPQQVSIEVSLDGVTLLKQPINTMLFSSPKREAITFPIEETTLTFF